MLSLRYFSRLCSLRFNCSDPLLFGRKKPTLEATRSPKGGLRQGKVRFLSSIGASMSSSTSPVLSENQIDQVDWILEGRNDDHEGVIVELSPESMDPQVFSSLLKASISQWRQQGKRGIWIKIPIESVNLVEPAVKEGFYFHHAEPKYLMLVHWLCTSENTLPANASHRVGVGAFVLNDKNEVLVVQEKNGRLRGSGVWKFPTGVAEEGEDICNAAVREVKEETGIDSKFLEILAFRQSHKAFFEKSDLFFVCLLEPLSYDIQPQENEIEAAQWMPYEVYAAQPFIQNSQLLKQISHICEAKKNNRYSGFTPVSTYSAFEKKKGYLYMSSKTVEQLQSSDS